MRPVPPRRRIYAPSPMPPPACQLKAAASRQAGLLDATRRSAATSCAPRTSFVATTRGSGTRPASAWPLHNVNRPRRSRWTPARGPVAIALWTTAARDVSTPSVVRMCARARPIVVVWPGTRAVPPWPQMSVCSTRATQALAVPQTTPPGVTMPPVPLSFAVATRTAAKGTGMAAVLPSQISTPASIAAAVSSHFWRGDQS